MDKTEKSLVKPIQKAKKRKERRLTKVSQKREI